MRAQVLLVLLSLSCFFSTRAEEETDKAPLSLLGERRKKDDNLIPFSFDKRPLTDIIEQLSLKKHVNIILPQLAADLEALKKQTVTFQPHGRKYVSVDEAWNLLQTFLDLSGFALSLKKPKLYAVVRVGRPEEPGIQREILPVFANTPPDQLPDSDERIRYIYYLRNLKVPGQEDRETNPIGRILRDMLTPGTPVIYEQKTNGIILTDKAHVISSVMNIISELDHSGFKETIEVVHLNNIPARDVVKIFDSLKKAAGDVPGTPYIRSDARAESLSYFAADTRIVADDRQNNVIIMGRQSAVERISDFIGDYMDTPPDTGKSVLHYYDLQYLDARQFAEVLTRIVAPPIFAGTQATQGIIGGPERYFQGVVVMAEEVKAVELRTTTEEITLEAKGGYLPTGLAGQQTITGGNRLIIAALHDDWLRLKDFIETIDKPQPYVILEVLVVDVRGTKQHLIAGTTRSKTDACGTPNGTQFLSSNISPVNNVLGNVPPQLEADLLRVISGDASNPPVTSLLAPGSLIMSFNDPHTPGIFALLQILDRTLNIKIMSHPFLITTNNQKATIASQELRRRRGDAVPGAAGVVTIEIIDLPATIQVQMIPRLSSLERLSLQIAVDINEFVDIVSDTRITRRVNTNANMATGQVLAIGGLTRGDQVDSTSGTPLLGNIPIIGSFFSSNSKVTTRNNLAIFICPTIVQPKLRGGLNAYTADKIRKSRRDMDEESVFFAETRDPITRLFFNFNGGTDKLLRDYLSQVTNPPDAELIQSARQKRIEATKPRRRVITKTPPPKPGLVGEIPA